MAKKLSKKLQKYSRSIKKKKSSISRKYNIQLEKVMTEKGYDAEEIKQSKKYSIPGKAIIIAKEKLVIKRYTKDLKKVYVKEKGWIKTENLNRSLKMRIYWAKVRSYKDLMGIDFKEARGVHRIIVKQGVGSQEIREFLYPE